MQGLENLFLQTSTGYTFTFHDFTDSLQIGVLLILWATLWVFIKQTKIQKVQLETSNYLAIFQQLDTPLSKASRRVIYHSHEYICELVKDYSKKDESPILDAVNEIARYMAGIYDSIWFLVKDNKELREKLIVHHGLTMGRQWKILQGLHQTWIDKDYVRAYVGFRELGIRSYDKNKDDVERYFENNYKKAKTLGNAEIFGVKNKVLGLEDQP